MKRSCKLTVLLAAAILGIATLVLAQSSVPDLVNFQGKLTTSGGSPVADGPHNFRFRIYDALVGGVLRWSEGPVAISTAGGLFNHQLGSSTPLPQTLFQDYDQLYLEIEADAEIQTPRIRLISTPYTRVANNLEVRDDNTDTVAIKTYPGLHQLSTFGTDGKEQVRLWGTSYGEVLLFDADATNDNTVRLTANASAGGELELRDDNGVNTIDLSGGLTGDASVAVPNDAVNSLELLNEPGVASSTYDGSGVGGITLIGGAQTVLSRTITVPAAGYVLVIGSCNPNFFHTNGSNSEARFGVSDVAGSLPANQDVGVFIPLGAATGIYTYAVTVHGLFSVTSGAHTFYLLADENFGDAHVYDAQLTLAYFPTAYGTVTPTLKPVVQNVPDHGTAATGHAMTPAEIAAEQAEAEKFNTERMARELMEVKMRMQKLEERLQPNPNAVENEQ